MLDQNITTTPKPKRRGRPSDPAAPFCIREHIKGQPCRQQMKHSGRDSLRWSCPAAIGVRRGEASFWKRETRVPRGFDPNRPYCVKCHTPCTKHGSGLWKCKACKWYASARRTQAQGQRPRTASGRLRTASGRAKTKRHSRRYALQLDHPQCIKCRWQMRRCGPTYKRRWECNLCGASCCPRQTAEKRGSFTGDALLLIIDSAIKGYSIDMREDLRQEIAVAILSQELNPATLTSATVKPFARSLFKLQSNRFRDVSLDHSYDEDGRTLAERLVG